MLTIGLVTLLALVISFWSTRSLSQPSSKFRILDHPSERSLHSTPVPRTGGLAIVLAIVISGSLAFSLAEPQMPLAWPAIGFVIIATVSFLDDRYNLSAGYRIVIHMGAASMLLYHGFLPAGLELPGLQWHWPWVLGTAITLFFVVWMVNLYNFMDGMDGFAAGMAVIGFGTFGLLGWNAGNELFAVLSWITAAAAAGFLVCNFPPSSIFMGDTGSSTLGFIASGLMLWASCDRIFPLWAAMLIFSPFIVDASVTLLHRLVRRERIWEAHKSHYYQKLVQLGWGHKRTVLWEYVLMLSCSISAVLALNLSAELQWVILGIWVIGYVVLMVWIDAKVRNRRIFST